MYKCFKTSLMLSVISLGIVACTPEPVEYEEPMLTQEANQPTEDIGIAYAEGATPADDNLDGHVYEPTDQELEELGDLDNVIDSEPNK